MTFLSVLNPSCPNPGRREKIKDLKGCYKNFGDTTKRYENES